MEKICLRAIRKEKNVITYSFSCTDGLSPYFTGKPFLIEYPFDITNVPDSIASIPFVCCVLPIVWMSDSILEIPELDEAFYDCIPNVKKGYETLYNKSVPQYAESPRLLAPYSEAYIRKSSNTKAKTLLEAYPLDCKYRLLQTA